MIERPSAQPVVCAAISYVSKGGYDVIKILNRTVRAPLTGEVRISVKAAAVNPTDILLRDPAPGVERWPIVPGMDAAGIVESVGADVSRLHVGQNVMAVVAPRRPEGGAQAQMTVVAAASVVPIPERTTFAEACTLPMNGLTALLALSKGALSKGQVFAVSGGAGLLAHYAIALAKRQGLHVIADAKLTETALVSGYGADAVVERGEDFAAAVRRVFPDGVDALLDTAVLGDKAFGAIRDGGTYLPVRGWGGPQADREIAIKPVFVNEVFERTDWLESLRDAAEAGDITLRVTGEYPMNQVADAQAALEAGGLRGRPVIVF